MLKYDQVPSPGESKTTLRRRPPWNSWAAILRNPVPMRTCSDGGSDRTARAARQLKKR